MYLFFSNCKKKFRKVRNSDKLQYTTPKKLQINIYGHNEKPQYRTPKKLQINIYGHNEKLFKFTTQSEIYKNIYIVSIKYYLKTYMYLFIFLLLEKNVDKEEFK